VRLRVNDLFENIRASYHFDYRLLNCFGINVSDGSAAAIAELSSYTYTPMSSYPEIHIGQGKQARFIICRATLFAKITYSRDDHCNLGYVFPGVDGGDDGGRHPRERGTDRIGGGRGRARARGSARRNRERGVASERVKECVRAGVSAPERHHHRCYLNVFVGGRRGGGVINVQVEERAAHERALTNSFAGARYGFTSREEVGCEKDRADEEGGSERETTRDGSERASASARGIEMLLMPGRAIGDKQK